MGRCPVIAVISADELWDERFLGELEGYFRRGHTLLVPVLTDRFLSLHEQLARLFYVCSSDATDFRLVLPIFPEPTQLPDFLFRRAEGIRLYPERQGGGDFPWGAGTKASTPLSVSCKETRIRKKLLHLLGNLVRDKANERRQTCKSGCLETLGYDTVD